MEALAVVAPETMACAVVIVSAVISFVAGFCFWRWF